MALALVLLAPTAVLSQQLPRVAPQEVGLSQERLQRLTEAFQKYVREERLAGAVVLVARHGKVGYFEAFGQRDREPRAPLTQLIPAGDLDDQSTLRTLIYQAIVD